MNEVYLSVMEPREYISLGRVSSAPDRDRARRDVVDEVVALRVGEGVERRPHDEHLGAGNRGAGLIAHPAFEFTSRPLGQEPTGSPPQGHCREREDEERRVAQLPPAATSGDDELHGGHNEAGYRLTQR